MAIDTREELINALHVACEVEHSLLVQYLYAGLSMKRSLDESLTTGQQRLLRGWQERTFTIARQEMGHLGIVCNLLAAIGAGPKLDRHPMPSKVGYFPFPFDLLPFGDEALYRFLIFELPRGLALPPPPGADPDPDRATTLALERAFAPEPIEYEYVGELYAQIAEGFATLPEAALFIGPREAQSDNDWSDPSLDIRVVDDRVSARAAIQNIIEDGEGTPVAGDASHYAGFLSIRRRYFDEGRFDAARRVPRNPVTRLGAAAPEGVTPILNPTSLALAELFNNAYGVMLLLLQHYFSLAPRSAAQAAQRQSLREAAQRIMSVAIRPLAEEVTLAPLDDRAAPERAGPTFEIYSDVVLSPYSEARWQILIERFDDVVAGCRLLGPDMPRVAAIAETLAIMRGDLAAAGGG